LAVESRGTLGLRIASPTQARSTRRERRSCASSSASILLLLTLLFPFCASAQIQISSVQVTVTDPSGALVRDAHVLLNNPINHSSEVGIANESGNFIFNNVPFDRYTLTVEASGFRTATQDVTIRSNLPVAINIQLALAGSRETMQVKGQTGLVEGESTSTETDIPQVQVTRLPGLAGSHALQQLAGTAPGVVAENDGLLHVRGVDDGVLYVVDGIPLIDRVDALSGTSPDLNAIRSMNVMTGSIPAEFGGRSGAVVQVEGKSGLDSAWMGSLTAGVGNFGAEEISSTITGSITDKLGIFVADTFSRSQRFLDPPDPRNFNNRGGAGKLSGRLDFKPSGRDLFILRGSGLGADLHVPNIALQETAGQRQREEFRGNDVSLSWNPVWSIGTQSSLAYYRQSYGAKLFVSPFDVPLFASQDRHHLRQGLIGNLTHSYHGHIFKAGIGYSHVTPHEFFTFAVTNPKIAEEQGFSDAAILFTRTNPFLFAGSSTFQQFSSFLQDDFSPLKNLTISTGLRFENSEMLVSDHQWSPRIGVVYYVPHSQTAIRASFNRLFMPPPVENLLLSSSAQTRQLSPFVSTIGSGGAPVHAERISGYEIGISQALRTAFRLDVSFWDRDFQNFDDPNVLFSTAIIFPNTVASGFARGLDIRLDVPAHHGWSGYLSYTNSRIRETGPINGGLFLTDEVIDIRPGTHFIPDHDQRNVGDLGISYTFPRHGLWSTFSGRYESGVPIEVDPDQLDSLRQLPGAHLVNFDHGRVDPRLIFGISGCMDLLERKHVQVQVQFDVENIANTAFVYNFGNPFSGTHFGNPRLFAGRLHFNFK
jgi:TonB dependent receptor/Carboxypeptidase regulatory-like domain